MADWHTLSGDALDAYAALYGIRRVEPSWESIDYGYAGRVPVLGRMLTNDELRERLMRHLEPSPWGPGRTRSPSQLPH